MEELCNNDGRQKLFSVCLMQWQLKLDLPFSVFRRIFKNVVTQFSKMFNCAYVWWTTLFVYNSYPLFKATSPSSLVFCYHQLYTSSLFQILISKPKRRRRHLHFISFLKEDHYLPQFFLQNRIWNYLNAASSFLIIKKFDYMINEVNRHHNLLKAIVSEIS